MPGQLERKRTLGRTGVTVPLVGYGTAPLGKSDVSREHAVRCLNYAIDHGMTYLDTSPDYGSEPHIGEVMRTRRDEVFLATKVNRRSEEGVRREVEESLRRLQTDHIDLIQVHGVSAWADLEQALAPDGAVTALEKAREEGLVRFIGITGHARPELLAEGLRRCPFDAVLIALGLADHLVTAPQEFFLPLAQEREVGVIAMKVLGHGHFQDKERALHYSLGLPAVSMAIVGLADIPQIETIIEYANRYRPLSEQEQDRLFEQVKSLVEQDARESEKGKGSLFWLHDTTVTGWAHDDVPAMVEY